MPDVLNVFAPHRGKRSTMLGEKKDLVLQRGELFIEYPDTGVGSGPSKIKIGDGTTTYENLPYAVGNDGSAAVITYTDDSSSTSADLIAHMASGSTLASIIAAAKAHLSKLASGDIPAGKADQLTTSRDISITGGATAAAVSFNGTGDVALNVTALDATKLSGTAAVDTTGNAGTATALAASKNFSITGGATAAAVAFDGSSDVALNVTALDATKLTGTVPLANLPAGATERCYVVADDTARLALTTDDVQNGDTVKVTATNIMYFVVDDTKLGTADVADAFVEYSAGRASSVDWSGVQNAPTSYPKADQLNTARDISITGGATAAAVSFNGTNDVALNVTALDATKLTGTAAVDTSGNAATATALAASKNFSITGGATAAAVAFDGSDNVALNVTALDASKLTGTAAVDTTGNAGTATKLASGITVTLTGVVTGTVSSVDGSSNVTIATSAGVVDFGDEE